MFKDPSATGRSRQRCIIDKLGSLIWSTQAIDSGTQGRGGSSRIRVKWHKPIMQRGNLQGPEGSLHAEVTKTVAALGINNRSVEFNRYVFYCP